jgi:hypothetical protein
VKYSRDEIAVTAYYRENPGEEITANDASGWVGVSKPSTSISDHFPSVNADIKAI